MAFDNRFYRLSALGDDVLQEVIREGELLMQAQMQAAIASDQRAMAWAGFLMTLATASAVGAATVLSSDLHYGLAGVAGLYAVLVAVAAWKAVEAARPTKFAFPGNSPANWLPECWQPNQPRTLRQARIEQAEAMQSCIVDNRAWAETAGSLIRESMNVALVATALAAVFVAAYVAWRLAS